jgi:hypothetical protein
MYSFCSHVQDPRVTHTLFASPVWTASEARYAQRVCVTNDGQLGTHGADAGHVLRENLGGASGFQLGDLGFETRALLQS